MKSGLATGFATCAVIATGLAALTVNGLIAQPEIGRVCVAIRILAGASSATATNASCPARSEETRVRVGS